MRALCSSLALLFAVGCGAPAAPSCSAEACTCGPTGCACPDGSSCGWTAVDGCSPEGAGCHLQCAARACVAGCDDVCEAGCTAGASCTVQGTESATLYCAASTCEIAGGAGTNAACVDGATCRVRCESTPCWIDCGEGSTCLLRCPGETEYATVTGTALCPTP